MIRLYIDFISSGHGMKECEELFGTDGVPFAINQPEGRKGRDVVYAGDSGAKFRMENTNDCFKYLIYNYNTYASQAKAKLKIDFGEGIIVFGNIDFPTIETDKVTFAEFTVVQESEQAAYKTNYDVKTNLFSNKDIKGNDITPVGTKKILIKAKPIIQVSTWDAQSVSKDWLGYGQDFAFIAPFPILKDYDIQVSNGPFNNYIEIPPGGGVETPFDQMTVVRAATNFRDIRIKIQGLNLEVTTLGQNVRTLIRVNYGNGYSAGQHQYITLFDSNSDSVILTDRDYDVTIPFINNTDKIWVVISIGQPNPLPASTPVSNSHIEYSGGKMTITSTSIAYNTVAPAVRYIDAIKYATKSAAALEAFAPRFDLDGEFYEQFITTTPLLRNLTEKPFNLSCKDIVEEHLRPELNGDYEIQFDSSVFYGIYEDFYRDYQIGEFEMDATSDDRNAINERFLANKLNVSFKNFASQKENEEANTYDLVHGETQWYIQNENVSFSREANIGFIRDAFYIEQQRRKAYDLSNTSATQDDDKVYILDTVALGNSAQERFFTETAALMHSVVSYNGIPGALVLRNQGEFSWALLGIEPGLNQQFNVNTGDNAGFYGVLSVSDVEIVLYYPSVVPTFNGVENTTFKYRVGDSTQLTIRTGEGFSVIENIEDGFNYANLRFTPKRIMNNYYKSELATINLYNGNKPIKNTVYKNNPEALTIYQGDTQTEGADFTPSKPLLTQFTIRRTLLMTLSEYWQLQTMLRQKRGYIKTTDVDGLPIKGFIKEGKWFPESADPFDPSEFRGKLEVVLEEKYESYILEIISSGGIITLNGQISPSDFSCDIDDFGNLLIFDENGKQLFVPVPFTKVKINNAQFTNSTLLLQTLTNLSNI